MTTARLQIFGRPRGGPARVVVAGAVVVVAALAHLGSAGAQLAGTSGGVVKVIAPASVAEDAYESDTEIRAFDESQGVTLAAPLVVDITAPGDYAVAGDLTPGTIPAGTRVDSHLLHADPVGSPDPLEPVLVSGAVTFDTEILGVIVLNTMADPHLNASDGVGAAATDYPDDLGVRGLEFSAGAGGDLVSLDDDHTLFVDLAMHRYDQVRVITAAPPVPTTTTTAPPITTTTTAPAISAATVAPTTTTTAPLPAPQVLGATLPRTGSPVAGLALLALVTLGLGVVALGFGRRSA